jgi:hypothetical protein
MPWSSPENIQHRRPFPAQTLITRYRHSIAHAISTFREPYAVLVDDNGQIEDYATSTGQSPSHFSPILQHFRRLKLDQSLLKIIFTITVFSADLRVWYETGICLVDSLEMQKHASLLMHRLFEWYQNDEAESSAREARTQSLDRSVCLALLIYIVNATEPNADFGARLSKAAVKLRLSLQQVPMVQWASAPNLFFWVATMGALGARTSPKIKRSSRIEAGLVFFRDYIRYQLECERHTHTTSVEPLLVKVRTCLWIPSVFDERVKAIWTTIGLCGPGVIELDDSSSSEGELPLEYEYALGHSTTSRFFSTERRHGGTAALLL